MQLTLLNVVQSYMNRTSDFPVSSIFDVDTSQQAAMIAEEVYYSLIQKFRDWEFTTVVKTLDSTGDSTKPNYLVMPPELQRIDTPVIEYNNITNDRDVDYQRVHYLQPHEFLDYVNKTNESTPNTEIVTDYEGTKFVIHNKRYPKVCTSLDGQRLIFDAYHSDYEDTLQASKSRVKFTKEEVFLIDDDFVIPIPHHLSELYRDLVIIECYEHLLQQNAPASMVRRVASRMASAQQHARKIGSMNRGKTRYGR